MDNADIYTDYIGYFEEIENDDMINFTNKKNTKYLHADYISKIERRVVKKINDKDEKCKYSFYINHIDLLLNCNTLNELLIEYKCLVANLEIFFNALKLNNNVYNRTSLPTILSTPQRVPKTQLRRKSDTQINIIKKIFKNELVFDEQSIFKKISIESFAISCNKLFMYYYLIMEIRLYQYKSINENFSLNKYAYSLKLFINNFYRILEKELYHNTDDVVINILKNLMDKFLEYGNNPLSNICMNLLERKIKKRNIKIYSKVKYTYLVNPDYIEKAFVSIKEHCKYNHEYNKASAIIYNKLSETRKEIIQNTEINIHPENDDYIVYNLLCLNMYLESHIKCFWPIKENLSVKT